MPQQYRLLNHPERVVEELVMLWRTTAKLFVCFFYFYCLDVKICTLKLRRYDKLCKRRNTGGVKNTCGLNSTDSYQATYGIHNKLNKQKT